MTQAEVSVVDDMGSQVTLAQPAQRIISLAPPYYGAVVCRRGGQYSQRPLVRVFYQVWHDPLITVNGEQLISDVVRLCRGVNVFSHLSALAPQISVEAVIAADPEVIIASGMGEARPQWLDDWLNWPEIKAVKRQQLYFVDPDLLHRHSPRILQGAKQVCEQLEQARSVSEQ